MLDEEMLDSYEEMLADRGSTSQDLPATASAEKSNGVFLYPGTEDSSSPVVAGKTKRKNRNLGKVNKNAEYHIVGFEESVSDIARMYAIDEKALRIRNRIPRDGEVYPGEKLYLKNKIRIGTRPEYSRDNSAEDLASEDTFIF